MKQINVLNVDVKDIYMKIFLEKDLEYVMLVDKNGGRI